MIKKKILLTGAHGMVGRNIQENARSKKYDLICPTRIELDLLDKKKVHDFIFDNKPDAIIHAAGKVGGIQANINNPLSFFLDNLVMGVNIVTSAKDLGVTEFINLGSSCMYPKSLNTLLTEDKILSGKLEPTNEGYALSKISISKLCTYINKENPSFKYKTLIPCNIYGKYDKFDPVNSHLIPAIINKIYDAKLNKTDKVEIWGDGEAKREFMYAEDLADAIFFFFERLSQLPDIMNIGLGYDYKILEYYEIIKKLLNYDGKFYFNKSKPVGMSRKVVSINEQNNLGWNPSFSLEKGLKKTISYYIKTIKLYE